MGISSAEIELCSFCPLSFAKLGLAGSFLGLVLFSGPDFGLSFMLVWGVSSGSGKVLNEVNLEVSSFRLVDFDELAVLKPLAAFVVSLGFVDNATELGSVLLLDSRIVVNEDFFVSVLRLGSKGLGGFGGGIEASRASVGFAEDVDDWRTDTCFAGLLLEEYLSKSSSSLLAAARLISFASPAIEDFDVCALETLDASIFPRGSFDVVPP